VNLLSWIKAGLGMEVKLPLLVCGILLCAVHTALQAYVLSFKVHS
jgi:hypothetical protein